MTSRLLAQSLACLEDHSSLDRDPRPGVQLALTCMGSTLLHQDRTYNMPEVADHLSRLLSICQPAVEGRNVVRRLTGLRELIRPCGQLGRRYCFTAQPEDLRKRKFRALLPAYRQQMPL